MMHVELSTAASVPRTTAPGATPRPGLPSEQLTITKATISILAQPGVEWYLDASICRGMMASGYDVISFMYFVTIVCLVVGSILALLLIHRSCAQGREQPRGACVPFHCLLAFFEQVWALVMLERCRATQQAHLQHNKNCI